MGASRPSLLPLFRSRTQLAVLGTLYANPTEALMISELAERVALPLSTVSREVHRLADAGFVLLSRRGRTTFVDANWSLPWARALSELLDQTVGVAAVIEESFAETEGVEEVWIYGSWAARHAGVGGPPPNDIDVLVVGEPSGLDIAAAARAAGRQIRVPVNVNVVDRQAWSRPDSFLSSIKEGPLVLVSDEYAVA